MATTAPTLQEWRKLYDLAMRVKTLAPWTWMAENDIFGIQNPETGDLGFISVMGQGGEHFAVALYLGKAGLYGLWAVHEEGPAGAPEKILQVPQLQASFEDRDTLHKEDRAVIKELGLKFRGKNAWPWFRSFRPAYFPWFLEANEVRFLTVALEQLLEVAPKILENPTLLEPPDDLTYLVRAPQPGGQTSTWIDQQVQVYPPEEKPILIKVNVPELEALKSVPKKKISVEVDVFILPMLMERDEEGRPFLTYNLLMAETQSGFVLGHQWLKALPSAEEMWGTVPAYVVHILLQTKIVPVEIRVRMPLLERLLRVVGETLKIKVRLTQGLPALDAAREFMFQRFR